VFYFDQLDLTVKKGEELYGTFSVKPNKNNVVSDGIHTCSSQNENLNLLARIKSFNFFLYSSLKN